MVPVSLSDRTSPEGWSRGPDIAFALSEPQRVPGLRRCAGSSPRKTQGLLISMFVRHTNKCPNDQIMKITFPKLSESIKMQFDETRRKTCEKLIFFSPRLEIHDTR